MAFPFKDRAVWEKASALDIYGQKKPGAAVEIDCSVIKMVATPALTGTGSNVSGSRGAAGDNSVTATLLVPLRLGIAVGDVVIVAGVHLQVVSVLPKTTVTGKVRFTQIMLTGTGL